MAPKGEGTFGMAPKGEERFAAASGRAKRLWLVLAAALFWPAAPASAEKFGDIDVLVQPLPNRDSRAGGKSGITHGYVEYRVQLKNLSTADHVVELSYGFASRGLGDDLVASRTVRVLGGQEAAVSLFEPPSDAGIGAGSMVVRVDGADSRPMSVDSLRGYRGLGEFAVLVSQGVPQDITLPESNTGGTSRSGPSPPAPTGPTLLRSDVAASKWSPNWLGYSCYDAVVATGQELDQMPAAVQAAVRRFVECGGTLWVYGGNVPDAFSRGGVADGQNGYHVGLGHVGPASDHNLVRRNGDSIYPIARFGSYRPQGRPADRANMLVAEAKVPARGLFLLILVFAVGIGPVNVWLLARFRRRIWLWWNVPAISLLACLAVFFYAAFSEGWTSRSMIASLTFLDERSHRATTIGYVSLYCPLAPGGLHFGVDTDVAQAGRETPDYDRYGPPRSPGRPRQSTESRRTVDWTVDQHLVSGWVTPRVPAYFQIRKNEDRRERLSVVKRADGSLAVVNALGADIRRVLVADASGRVFEGQDIPAGAERTLSPANRTAKSKTSPQAELRSMLLSNDWLGRFQSLGGEGSRNEQLVPGSYIATLAESPFVELPLAGASRQDTAAIVYGIIEGGDTTP